MRYHSPLVFPPLPSLLLMNFDFATLAELLRDRAMALPDRIAYAFLRDGFEPSQTFSFGDLDRRARAIAVALQESAVAIRPGDRVLLIYPAGIEFIAGFFGCLYAGAVPIPAPAPDQARFKRAFPRLRGIIDDATARLILTTESILEQSLVLDDEPIAWLASDRVEPALAARWTAVNAGPDDLAYLQYTSGSTSKPKGVMLSHRNVLENLAFIRKSWGYDETSVSVTWMPYFHDYGLVDGLLQPVFNGNPCYVLSPLTFIKRPQRWLEAISRYRGTHTQGPNFAFQLCVDKITPAQRDALDLSSLRVASNGAEQIRQSTLQRFCEFFAPCGFRVESLFPSYGLAEATLMVTTRRLDGLPRAVQADAAKLEREHCFVPANGDVPARTIVSCGAIQNGMEVVIVEPVSGLQLADGAIGEIWVAHPSVALGYWNKPVESEAIFRARLRNAPDDGPWLRTGDVGFIDSGELFITGRLKDLIIIAGVNHYPHDIEWTVQKCHPDIRADHCAAFSVDVDGEERLVVAAEIVRDLETWDELLTTVRQVVSEAHEMELCAFVALKKGGMLKTSSGKLQRSGCRTAFLEDTFDARFIWRKPVAQSPSHAMREAVERGDSYARWLTEALAVRLNLAASAIDLHQPFASYGLTSRLGVELVGDLEQWLGRDDLSPTLLWQFPTIATLSRYLAGLAEDPLSAHYARATTQRSDGGQPLAIIGVACRFPGADDPEAFWRLLHDKVDAVGLLPHGRWNDAGIALVEGTGPGQLATLQGGFLGDVARFDADLFGIGGREAEIMDPQQRMLLELTWEALERAGIDADALAGSNTGVFIGISTDDYATWQLADPMQMSAYTGPAKALSIAANRISYQFDFHGPSMSIDTACSSSLVAIHQAANALRLGECEVAIAGGVNLLLAPHMSIALTQAGMLSPDGRCKTFDAAANGYVRGEGCGLIVLKRLETAQRDGDAVIAVLRGSAVNQDGRSNGLTAPNGLAQQQVIHAALDSAGVAPASIGYVETHGTGTVMGDPIEVKSLQAVLSVGRADGQRCALGAVKASIGHLEAAAGVASVIKAAMSVQRGEVLPHPTLRTVNLLIELEKSVFTIPTSPQVWPDSPRLAGVSSFGFGGTNAHLILESPPESAPPPPPAHDRPLHLLSLKARDGTALRALAERWFSQLDQVGTDAAAAPVTAADLCHTANRARAGLPQRLAFIATDTTELKNALASWLEGGTGNWVAGQTHPQRVPRVGFLFTGQGSQFIGMAAELYRTQPGFRRDLDACDAVLRECMGQSIVGLLYGAGADSVAAERLLARTDITQPALFAVEYSLARLWQSWGIEPVAMLGHSVGEYVAAAIAGVFSLEDGLRLIAARARLMQQAPGDGAMTAVVADAAQCHAALAGYEDQVVIGVINGARNHVLSGERDALAVVVARLSAQGCETRPVNVSHAFHSPLMDPVLTELRQLAGTINYHAPTIQLVSNVTGEIATAMRPFDAAYWVTHLRSPVQFAAGIKAMRAAGVDAFIEIGPRPTLIALAQQTQEDTDLLWLPSLRAQVSDTRRMFESLAQLHVRGTRVDWLAFDAPWPRRRVAIPTYPFQGRRYWLPALTPKHDADLPDGRFPGRRVASPLLSQIVFENRYDTAVLPWLGEHRVFDRVVVPGAAHLSWVLEAASSFYGQSACELADVIFPQALVVPEPGARRLQLVFEAAVPGEGRLFKLISLPAESDDSWEEHAMGRLRECGTVENPHGLARAQALCLEPAGEFYSSIWQSAIALGPRFRWIDTLWRGEGQVLARLRQPTEVGAEKYRMHPGLLDSMLQTLAAAVSILRGDALVPFSFESFCWLANRPHDELWSHVVVRTAESTAAEVVCDVVLYAADGTVLAKAIGFRTRRVASRDLLRETVGGLDHAVYGLHWIEATDSANDLSARRGNWGVAGRDIAAIDALCEALRAAGQPTVRALPLSAERIDLNLTFDRIVYLAGEGTVVGNVVDATRLACTEILHLLQAVLARGAPWPELLVVTRQAQPLDADDALRVDQAALWGMLRVLRLEQPALRCRSIDLDHETRLADLPSLLERNGEPEVALRNGRLRLPRLRAQKPAPTLQPEFRRDACYLISGGFGALGQKLAEWLVAHGVRHLLLIGRRVPEAAAARIEALEASGAKIEVGAIDVADLPRLRQLLQERAGPPVVGVFHLAGVLEDALIEQQNGQRLGLALQPKLAGALALEQALEQTQGAIPLELFVSFTSLAALSGSMGQVAYAAANAALDAQMAQRRRRGLAGLSLQWGPWADAGMAAAQSEQNRQRFVSYGIEPIDAAAGLVLLGRLLTSDGVTRAIMPVNWPTYLGQLFAGHPPPLYAEVQPANVSGTLPAQAAGLAERLLAAAPAKRRALLDEQLKGLVSAILGLGDSRSLGPRQRLFDLGLDSLGAVELRNRLAAALGRTLRATLLFDYPTLQALGDHIERDVLGLVEQTAVAMNPAQTAPVADLTALSDDELANMLAAELGS